MSKTILHRPVLRIALLALIACAAAAFAASPAAAAPPIGTQYCMDSHETFSTWDVPSQHVSDKVVTQFGGLFTAGEVDPANIGRDALRQYWDALETSDAIGNYGIDTTIPNYIVHTISLGACPVQHNNVFLCYSKFQTDPGVWPAEEAPDLMNDGYWSPSALNGNVAGGTNVGGFHLVCNPPAADFPFASNASPVDPASYVGGSGELVGISADGLPGYYPYLG